MTFSFKSPVTKADHFKLVFTPWYGSNYILHYEFFPRDIIMASENIRDISSEIWQSLLHEIQLLRPVTVEWSVY